MRETIGLLRKLQNTLPRPAILTICNGDIIYDQAYNLSFYQKLESIH